VSEHISEELAMALSALPEDDAERALAVRHAAGCPACQKLLDEGAAMLSLLDRELTPPPVGAQLEAQVRAAVLAPRKKRWEPFALGAGALLSLLMVWLDRHPGELAPALGVKCALLELGAGVVPFAWVGQAVLRGQVPVAPLRLALMAMGGGLAAQAFLLTECPARGALSHTLVFHFGGVLLAALLGYGGGRILARSAA
jgi:hypothetical protein